MKNKEVVASGISVAGSLAGYYMAPDPKEKIPYMLIGGFLGTVLAAALIK
ncbi:hypothetical protein [Aureibacter tunicatorum]|uniref:Uncharacterized protein n=1 Tax=Aureibacter tunicatorum TaxID=866807 RepID=A0AAE3XQ29_9BACT|nr:hypothetical protein [Aureibacter tunicatorum]MDR6239933.1 hypothetical protein [Aureibacter tunicatorum]MDR6239970.1 hypothetical protein [Aureibacter tunicatorum]